MNIKNTIISTCIIGLFAITTACDGGKMAENITYDKLDNVPASAWKELSHKKIYFGHQSVGFNIIDGVEDLMKEYPEIKLNIVETNEASFFEKGAFLHSRIGENYNPISKVIEFKKIIDQGIGERADAVALKFCYVDIKKKTDPEQIFDVYLREISKIKETNPDLVVIHFTVPLKVRKTTWKSHIRKIFRKGINSKDLDNIKRNKYNNLLIDTFNGKEPIFDIAKYQSTFQDGSRSKFKANGRFYYSMAKDYSTDGGHLNEIGKKRIAEKILIFLSKVLVHV